MSEGRIQFRNHDDVRTLFGSRDKNLRRLRDVLHLDVVLRGDELHLHGDQSQVELGKEIVSELRSIIERKGLLDEDDFDRALMRGHSPHESSPDETIDVFHKARKVRPMSSGQRDYIKAIREHDLVICEGPAGSGKTYLAVAMAINALRMEQVRRIVLVRPAVEAGEKLGFLPGDMLAKVNPYLRPLLDALSDILDFDQVQRYLDKEVIEIIPLAFMRGRTLNNTFMILDEAQNSTITQMKMFLTRMGHHSKIVVTGDGTQTDLPDRVESGLNDAFRRLRNIEGVAAVSLSGLDIVRHALVRRIVEAYEDKRDERATEPLQSASNNGTENNGTEGSVPHAGPNGFHANGDGQRVSPSGDPLTDQESAVGQSGESTTKSP